MHTKKNIPSNNRFERAVNLHSENELKKRILTADDQQILVNFISLAIADGVTYFEELFDAVRHEVGDYSLEQQVVDILKLHDGELWKSYNSEKSGPFYKLLSN